MICTQVVSRIFCIASRISNRIFYFSRKFGYKPDISRKIWIAIWHAGEIFKNSANRSSNFGKEKNGRQKVGRAVIKVVDELLHC
jgi:hypothetical protein